MPTKTEARLNDEPLIDYRGASRVIDTPVGTLQVWVSTGRYGIPFYKVGYKVRFKRSELLTWLATRKRGSGAVSNAKGSDINMMDERQSQ